MNKFKNGFFVSLLVLPLLVNFLNWQRPEADPFIHYQAKPLAYTALDNEPLFNQQFQFNHLNRGTTLDNYRGQGVTVAIIDSGLNSNHVDFFDGEYTNILPTSAHIKETGNYISEISVRTVGEFEKQIINDNNSKHEGHGTTVAGTIGALVNGVGTVGVSPEVNLMILKTDYFFTEINYAITYAADNGADIINMSIGAYATSFKDGNNVQQTGISGADTYFQSAINYAHDKGVTIIAAAGNENTDVKSYPASNNHVVGVGALARNSSTQIASYSNSGLNNVDIVAPGSVYVSDVGSSTSYTETQGTSFAAPIVASAAALYKGKFPSASPAQIEQKLKDTAYDLGSPGVDTTFCHGRLDLSALLNDVAVTGVELNPASLTMRVGETSTVTANILPANATNKTLLYISDNDDVATVDEDTGLVTAIGIGTTQIGVLTEDGDFEAYTQVTVIDETTPVTVTAINIIDDDFTLGIGDTKSLSLNLTPSNATRSDLNFTSSNSAIASVSSSGVVSALSVGQATITVSAKDGTATDTILVTVGTVNNLTKTFSFTNKSWAATPTNWTSTKDGLGYANNGVQVSTAVSGASAVSPTSFNNIQSIKVGYTTNASTGTGNIKVYINENSNMNNKQLIDTFNVTTKGGTTKRDTAAFIPKTLKSGYIQIEVDVTANSIYVCDIKIIYQEQVVAPISVSGVNFTNDNLSLLTGTTSQLTYTLMPSNATNKNVTFTSSNTNVATVSGTGLITAKAQGLSTIRVTTDDGGFISELLLTVNDPITYEPQLTLNTTNFKTNYTFKESLDLANLSATYRSANGDLTTLNGNQLTLTSGGTTKLGSSTLTFTYLGKSVFVNITVTNIGAIQESETPAYTNLSLTIEGFSTPLTNNESSEISNSHSGIEFRVSKIRSSGTNFFIGQGGYIGNITSLTEIKSIRFDYLSGGSDASNQNLRFGNSQNSTASGEIHTTLTTSTPGKSQTVNAPAGSSYFRIDVSNKNLQALITINYRSGNELHFTAEQQAEAYNEYFMSLTAEECSKYDVKASTWTLLNNEYNSLVEDAKTLIKSPSFMAFQARYNVIINAYNYKDFIYGATPFTRINFDTNNFVNNNTLILLVGVLSFLSCGSYILFRKHKR